MTPGVDPDLAVAMAEARADMAEILTDRVRVTRAGDGEPQFNKATGKYVKPPRVVVYEGPGRFQIRADINANVVQPVVAEREWSYQTSSLQIPVLKDPNDTSITGDPADVRIEMVVECVAAPYEPALVGRQFGIQANQRKSQATCRRMRIKEVTG